MIDITLKVSLLLRFLKLLISQNVDFLFALIFPRCLIINKCFCFPNAYFCVLPSYNQNNFSRKLKGLNCYFIDSFKCNFLWILRKNPFCSNRAPKNINSVLPWQSQREPVERNTYFKEICDCGFY